MVVFWWFPLSRLSAVFTGVPGVAEPPGKAHPPFRTSKCLLKGRFEQVIQLERHLVVVLLQHLVPACTCEDDADETTYEVHQSWTNSYGAASFSIDSPLFNQRSPPRNTTVLGL